MCAPRAETHPMLSIGTVVMGVGDIERAVAFWTAALGYVPKRPMAEDDDFMILVPPDGAAGTHLALDTSETPVQDHPRVHLDLYAGDAADQEAEVARRVDWDRYPADADFIVVADPEGNRFCVIDTSR